MTAPLDDIKFEKLQYFLKGDMNAVKFCIDLIYLSHYWDDIFDGDMERTPEEANDAFQKALIDIPENPFYQACFSILQPMIRRTSLLWMDSNTLARGNQNDKLSAFMIRNDLLNIIHTCIILVGGVEWAKERGVEFWRTLGIPMSKFHEFMMEFEDET